MIRPRRLAVPALLLLLAAPAAAASPGVYGDDDRVEADNGAAPWSAIGRVNRTTGGFCTGTLIGPRLVLTAAHCLWNRRTGRWLPASALHFLVAYRRGEWAGHSTVERFAVASDIAIDAKGRPTRRASDWAVLVLAEDLAGVAATLPLAGPDAAGGGRIAQAGYNQDKAHILSLHLGCPLLGLTADRQLLLHRCDATPGSSGSPILVERDGVWRLLAVHVGTGRRNGQPDGQPDGQPVGVAVLPPPAELRAVAGR